MWTLSHPVPPYVTYPDRNPCSKAGGKDNGKPGLRRYAPGYYAAFIYDPDGHNIEALCFSPWWMYGVRYGKYVAGVGVLGLAYWLGGR